MRFLGLFAILSTALSVTGTSISNVTLHGSLSHPSKYVTLVYPDSRAQYNQKMAVGIINPPAGLGFLGNVSTYMTYPNGTSLHLGDMYTTGYCPDSTNDSTGSGSWLFITDAIGSYQASWKFNYTYFTDSATAETVQCGQGGTSSSEIFVLNQTFEVANLGKGVVTPTVTTSSQLPSQPTGFFQNHAIAAVPQAWLAILIMTLLAVTFGV